MCVWTTCKISITRRFALALCLSLVWGLEFTLIWIEFLERGDILLRKSLLHYLEIQIDIPRGGSLSCGRAVSLNAFTFSSHFSWSTVKVATESALMSTRRGALFCRSAIFFSSFLNDIIVAGSSDNYGFWLNSFPDFSGYSNIFFQIFNFFSQNIIGLIAPPVEEMIRKKRTPTDLQSSSWLFNLEM